MKKQTLVRAAAGVLAVCMTAGTLAGCSSSKKAEETTAKAEETTTAAGGAAGEANTSNEAPTHLKLFLTNKNIVDGSYAKTMIEQATNTELEIIQVPTKELDNKLNILLISSSARQRPWRASYYLQVFFFQSMNTGIIIQTLKTAVMKQPGI